MLAVAAQPHRLPVLDRDHPAAPVGAVERAGAEDLGHALQPTLARVSDPDPSAARRPRRAHRSRLRRPRAGRARARPAAPLDPAPPARRPARLRRAGDRQGRRPGALDAAAGRRDPALLHRRGARRTAIARRSGSCASRARSASPTLRTCSTPERIGAMASFESVRVAAIQATPVILDAAATIEKAERLLHEAADAGARLAVLPECFVSLYPSNAWARGRQRVQRLGRAVAADVGGVGRRPRAAARPAGRRLPRAQPVLRDRRQRARVRAARLALQHARLPRAPRV